MKMTQCDRIMRHLVEHGSITSIEAITEYGILRLASRINDLKRKGVKITSKTGTSKNRYGEKVHYSVYMLSERKESNQCVN